MGKFTRAQVVGRSFNGRRFYSFDNNGLRCKTIRRPFLYKGFKVEIRDNVVFAPFRYEWKITALTDNAKNAWAHWNAKRRGNARRTRLPFIETDPTSWLQVRGECGTIDSAKENINFLTSIR